MPLPGSSDDELRVRRRLGRLRLPFPGLRRRTVLYGLGAATLVSFVAFLWIDRSVVHRFETRTTTLPSRVYSRPYTIDRGGKVDAFALLARLEQLSYSEVPDEPAQPGEFRRDGNDWQVYLRTAVTPAGKREARPVKLGVVWGRLRRIIDQRTGERLDSFSLEPEPMITFYADVMEDRRWTALKDIARPVRDAVEVVEDRRFRRHHGVDLIGIGRAFVANLRAGGVVQGGSTITQQLAKNLYGPGERTLRRKLLEAIASVALELHYDKDEILEAYLNEVYLGQLGPVAISGVGDAADFFFGAHARDLDLPQSALLAGMIRNPGRYNPRRHPLEARQRRDLVLKLMHERGTIGERRLQDALAAPIEIADASVASGRFPWIEDYLAAAVSELSSEAVPSRAGYSIFTTFDPRIQRAAHEALEAGLERLERRTTDETTEPLEGAIVVIRPSDGSLAALVGGRDYARSQYNRVTLARRPPGSTFKPFVFLAALERAQREASFDFTVATVLEDAPLQLQAGGRPWNPANYDRRFRGPVTAREALEQSINVPTVRAALLVGLPEVVETAHRCGIESDLEAIPALALGVEEVVPLELARAYATLANGGWRIKPHGLVSVIDRDGRPQDYPVPRPQRAVTPELAYLLTDMLEGVVERGTARSATRLGFSGTAAGKTGSSDGLRDAWFVGYTPELLALVWVGRDDNRPVGLPGAAAALPIWVDLMTRIGAEDADRLERPAGVVEERVDPVTGELATRRCPNTRKELFVRGSAPREACALHGGERRTGFWKRVFGRRG